MPKLVALAGLVLAGGVAEAEPTARFGLTGALADQGSGGAYELGPQVALGERFGAFVGELDYAYLSFFDSAVSPGGVHRVDVTLRADLVRTLRATRCTNFACTRATSFYGELGAGERFGRWIVDATHAIPATTPQPELHFGLGLELDNLLVPRRNGWQLGLRFVIAPRDAQPGVACRGGCTSVPGTPGGLDHAVFVEWMFVI